MPASVYRRLPLRLLGLGIALLLAAVLAALVPAGAGAQGKQWRIDRMDVLLDVQADGDVLVDETVTFAFTGNYHVVTRSIPTTNLEGIEVVAVFREGAVLPRGSGPGTWDTTQEGDRRLVKLNFDLTDSTAAWTVRYRAAGAVRFFDEGDELRWYVFDAETPVPIEQVTATVKLPGSVAPDDMTGAIQTGPTVERAVASPGPSTLEFTGSGVPPYTEFWIVAGFPKGVVHFTWTPKRVGGFLVPKVGFLLPIAGLLGMLVVWRRRGRDDPQAVFAKYATEPPSALPPALAGALVDEKVDVKEVISTIVDLARRGYFEMADEREGIWVFAKTITHFRRLKPLHDLTGFEREVADGLFPDGGDETTSDLLKNRFYKVIRPFCDGVYDEVTRRHLFTRNPKSVRSAWLGTGIGLGVLLVGLGILFAVSGIPGYGYWIAGSVFAALIVMGFSRYMPSRTTAGAQEQRKWEAFRNYLRDLARFQDMATAKETFERYLPYAIAFGVEKDWVRRFHDLQVPAPDWYRPVYMPGWGPWIGPGGMPSGSPGDLAGGGVPNLPGAGGFSLDTISDGLFGSLHNMSSVLTSAPSSSGSGGGAFGGGGSFGGGFSGGGGGGGFSAN